MAESFAHRDLASEIDLALLLFPIAHHQHDATLQPIRGISLFFKDPPIFPPFATIWAAKIGKVRTQKYIIQRNSEIKEVTNFLKVYLQFHFHHATVSVTNNFFLYCESSIKCDSEIIILKWSPPSREIGKKSESVMGWEVG